MYKQWRINILEICFLFNLAVFRSLALFYEAHGGSKDSLACTSLGITFLLFVAITGYHIWRRIRFCKKKRKYGYDNIDTIVSTTSKGSIQSQSSVTHQTVTVPELRESLLEEVT